MKILLEEAMIYKEQIKTNELITKLRIIKLVEKASKVTYIPKAEASFLRHLPSDYCRL